MDSSQIPAPTAPNMAPPVLVNQQPDPRIAPQSRRVLVLFASFFGGFILSGAGALLGLAVAFQRASAEGPESRSDEAFVRLFEFFIEVAAGAGIGYLIGALVSVVVATVGTAMSGDLGLGGVAAFLGALLVLPVLALALGLF